jgi:hypothetical protein
MPFHIKQSGSTRGWRARLRDNFPEIVSATGGAMGDLLRGASWGAWFVLAAISAADLWTIVH